MPPLLVCLIDTAAARSGVMHAYSTTQLLGVAAECFRGRRTVSHGAAFNSALLSSHWTPVYALDVCAWHAFGEHTVPRSQLGIYQRYSDQGRSGIRPLLGLAVLRESTENMHVCILYMQTVQLY